MERSQHNGHPTAAGASASRNGGASAAATKSKPKAASAASHLATDAASGGGLNELLAAEGVELYESEVPHMVGEKS